MTTETETEARWLLEATPITPGRPLDDSQRAHNRTVSLFLADGAVRRSERGLLAMAQGIDQLIGSWSEQVDQLSTEYVWDIVRGWRYLLNHDIGRLDARTCDEWASAQLERWNIDPDTGEWRGER